MHRINPSLFHRDIRWANVLFSPPQRTTSSSWFLIDFDDAATAPTRAAMHLDIRSHHPNIFRDGHGAEVDIWGVGKLILDSGVTLSDELASLGRDMVKAQMSAEDALTSLQRSGTRATSAETLNSMAISLATLCQTG